MSEETDMSKDLQRVEIYTETAKMGSPPISDPIKSEVKDYTNPLIDAETAARLKRLFERKNNDQ